MNYETSTNEHQITPPGRSIKEVAISPNGHIYGLYVKVDGKVSCLSTVLLEPSSNIYLLISHFKY